MQQLGVKIADNQYRIMVYADMTGLNVVKDDRNNVYLEGDVTFTDEDYNWLITRKVYDYDIQLEVRWEGFNGVMSLAGEWNYDRKRCKLKVSSPETFETILNKEYFPTNKLLEFEYNSWSVKVYSEDGYVPTNYAVCAGEYPPVWNSEKEYTLANGSAGSYNGDEDQVVLVINGGTYFFYYCISTPNQGNPPPTDGSSNAWWYCNGTGTDTTYGQEQARFQFDNNAEYDKLKKIWKKPNCTASVYTGEFLGINIKEELQNILDDNDFVLSTDWLEYPKNINTSYEDSLYLANTERLNTITLKELIDIIEQAFNVRWYLNGDELYFRHFTEQQSSWNSSLPTEHDLSSIDIYDWTREEFKDVKRHKLIFTESDLGTHNNSVIEYENNFTEDAEVKPIFDVDFVYAYNEGDTPVLVTVDSSFNIDKSGLIYNNHLIPSDIHENFYFSGREYNRGTFQENLVSLQEDYNETTERQLSGNYDINNWNVFNLIRINGLTGKTTYNYAKLDKVVYSIDKNNFKLSLKTKT